MILGAVWGLLTSTRLLRGEEDAGGGSCCSRGQTTRRGAAAQALGGPGRRRSSCCGRSPRSSRSLAGLDSKRRASPPGPVALLRAGHGGDRGHVPGRRCARPASSAATRRQAAAFAAVFLGSRYAVRMIADAGVGLHGLIWVSPLGWVEELQPLTVAPAARPCCRSSCFTAVLAARRGAARRHPRTWGRASCPDRAHGPAAPAACSSDRPGLAIRLMQTDGHRLVGGDRPCPALLYGLIAKSAGATISGSSVTAGVHQARRHRDRRRGRARRVLPRRWPSWSHSSAAGQVTAARSEESEGRLDHLLVRPVSRRSLARRPARRGAWLCSCSSGVAAGSLRLARRGQPARRCELHDSARGRA